MGEHRCILTGKEARQRNCNRKRVKTEEFYQEIGDDRGILSRNGRKQRNSKRKFVKTGILSGNR